MGGGRVRGLLAAVDPDEPLRLAEKPTGGDTPGVAQRAVITVASGNTNMAVGKLALLIALAATGPCRIRLYSTSAARGADADRPPGTLPAQGSGCLLEFIATSGLLSAPLAPAPTVSNLEVPPVAQVYANILADSGSVDVTFTYLKLE